MPHAVMTFVAQVKTEKNADLSALLDTIGNNPETNPYVPFRKLKPLHFASLVLARLTQGVWVRAISGV